MEASTEADKQYQLRTISRARTAEVEMRARKPCVYPYARHLWYRDPDKVRAAAHFPVRVIVGYSNHRRQLLLKDPVTSSILNVALENPQGMQAVDEVEVRRGGRVAIVIAIAVITVVKEWCPVLLRLLSVFPSNREHGRHGGEGPV